MTPQMKLKLLGICLLGGLLFAFAGSLSMIFDNAENVAFLHDQQLFAVDLDFGAGPFAEQNAVAFLHVEGYDMPFLVAGAWPNGNNLALLRLLFGRIRDDDSALRALFLFQTAHYDAVMQRPKLHGYPPRKIDWNGRGIQ